jgi:uncharacterized protein YegJ (DUF2314 family)
MIAVGFIMTCASAQKRASDEVIMVKRQNKEMNQAMQQAKDTLPQFIKAFKNPTKDQTGFSIKVRIEDSNGVEHFWTANLALLKEGFSAQIANEPQTVKSVQYAQKVNFQISDVSDWMYYDKGVVQGGYTIKVLLKTMPKAEATSLKKELGW